MYERFSRLFSFAQLERHVVRTIPAGEIVRTTGVFGRNGPEPALYERLALFVSFVQRGGHVVRTISMLVFVRTMGVCVSRALQYTIDFRLDFRSRIEGNAVREPLAGSNRGAGPSDRPPLGHETGVLHDSAGPFGIHFQGRSALRTSLGSASRRNPGSGTFPHFATRTKGRAAILP